MKLKNAGDLYNYLFQGNPEAIAKAKEIMHELKKECVPDDKFVKAFTKKETDSTLYKMKRHECHALLHNLQEAGLITERGGLWCLDDNLLRVLERMIEQVAELHNLSVRIEYSTTQPR